MVYVLIVLSLLVVAAVVGVTIYVLCAPIRRP